MLVAALAGCGGGSSNGGEPELASAKPFADGFVRRFVAPGDWTAVEDDVSPLVRRDVRAFRDQLRRDRVRKVVRDGELRHDCPENAVVEAGNDCFRYRLAGRQVEPISGRITKVDGTLLLWLERDEGRWQVSAYSYDAKVKPA